MINHKTDTPSSQKSVGSGRIRPTNPFIQFKKEEVEQSIPTRFEQQVRQYPDRMAIKSRDHTFTYESLNQAANRVAWAICDRHSHGHDPIALLLEHDAPALIAMLGVLKAGRIYVPLDPGYPPERLSYILENCQVGLIVTNSKNLSLAKKLTQDALTLLNIDDFSTSLSTENLDLKISPDSVTHILYTSGSTGKPKGVPQLHRNVLHEIMNYTNAAHLSTEDRMLLVSSFSFGDSVRTIYGALLNGASLFPLNIKEEGFVSLSDWMIEQEITIYRSVPTVFRHFARTLSRKMDFPVIRLIYLAGEPVYRRDVMLYRDHFSSDCILVNGLGSIESLTYRWYFLDKNVHITGTNVPVGFAIDDMEVQLLGDNGKEVGVNEIGEIAVKSRYLSPGYGQNPDLTRQKFRPDPKGGDEPIYLTGDLGLLLPDECLVHMGRKDFQVKIRGYRVETAEIEMLLMELDTVKETVVVARTDASGDKYLSAYVVPIGDPGPAVGELRSFLEGQLPEYMMPSTFVLLDAIPLTPNGKVDRQALPAPDGTRPLSDNAFAAPGTPLEERIADIWVKVLGLDQVGVQDNFFELGGHSLSAIQAVSRMSEAFQVALSLSSFFETPTIAQLSRKIESIRSEGAGPRPPALSRVRRDSHHAKLSSQGVPVSIEDTQNEE
ncbi:MAG: non-ribosomal peptide synthetase [Gemmatimonadota bacterium]|nr:MAG: non-ribosomal peptide synthetase [Gemmatimonadota bacterium]